MRRRRGRWLRGKDLVPQLPLRMKQARQEAKLSQDAAAERLGVERNTVWRWEAGQHEPSWERLETLAALYNKPVSWFLGIEESKQEAEPYNLDPKLEKVVRRLAELPAGYLAVVEGVIEKLAGLTHDNRRRRSER